MYQSREAAGIVLGEKLSELNLKKPYLLAIPRGGIQVAEGIADKLKIPINPTIAKKLPIPGNPETAFGAMTGDGIKVIDNKTVSYLNISDKEIDEMSEQVLKDIKHREEVYGSVNEEEIKDKDAIITDDGIATGYSIIAAIKSIRKMNPARIITAVPVSSEDGYEKVSKISDITICPIVEKSYFFAVGNYYREWSDLSEEEIIKIINTYRQKYSKNK